MSYISIPITASGGTIDNYLGFSTYSNVLFYTASPVTLTTSLALTPSIDEAGASFDVRWNADVTLDTFSVTICGFTISQDQVNQSGTFSCYYDGTSWSVQYFADGSDRPQIFYGVNTFSIPTSGTVTFVAGVDKFYQRGVGSPTTLASALNVTASTSGIKDGAQFYYEIAGGVTIGANTYTAFGQTISAADALNGGAMVIATFDATATTWRSVYINKSIAIGQLPSVAALTVIANATNATATPTAVAASSNGRLFMRRSNALAFDWIGSDNFNGSTDCLPLKYLAISIPSSEVLTSFATPITILDSVTAGGLPIIQSILLGTSSGGSAYATNTDIGIRPVGGSDDICSLTGALAITGTDFYTRELIPNAPASGAVIFGGDVEFYTKTGNPTAGTRNVLIMIVYTVIPAP
jgi:hypothetical protein